MARVPPTPAAARRITMASAAVTVALGAAYVATFVTWLVRVRTPAEPVGDPYLALMEGLTILAALALLGLFAGLHRLLATAHAPRLGWATGLWALGTLLTLGVHSLQLTLVRDGWRAGTEPDYRLLWPSTSLAVEYAAWDLCLGVALLLAAGPCGSRRATRGAGRLFAVAGGLCLAALSGPLTGHIALNLLALVGYGVLLPVGAALLVRGLEVHPYD